MSVRDSSAGWPGIRVGELKSEWLSSFRRAALLKASGAFLGVISLLLGAHAYTSSPLRSAVARMALERVRQNRDTVAALGEPIRTGWGTQGTVKQDATGWGEARLEVPVHGPRGRGKLQVMAGKDAGKWMFAELNLVVDGEHKKIDLVRGSVETMDAKAYEKARALPAGKPELLPIPMANPEWDGAYPHVVIKMATSENDPPEFVGEVERVKPMLEHEAPLNQFEVDLHSGMFVLRQTDFFAADSIPIELTRTYRPWDWHAKAFGTGTSHTYDINPTGSRNPYRYLQLNFPDGGAVHFDRISMGSGFADAVYRHDQTKSEFYGSEFAWNGNGWTLRLKDGSAVIFPESYDARSAAQGAPVEMRNAAGDRMQLKRNAQRNLTELISPAGYDLKLKYDGLGRIDEARDDAGNVRRYSYTADGHLGTVSDGTHVLYQFRYDALLDALGYDKYLMTSISSGDGRLLLHNEYADGSRVSEQVLGSGETYRYSYNLDCAGDVREAKVTMPSGETARFSFGDGAGAAKGSCGS